MICKSGDGTTVSIRLLFLLVVAALVSPAQQVDWVRQVRNRPIYDVRNYGTAAISLGVVDALSAIQAAVDAANAAGGGYVIAPLGNYKVSAKINLKAGVHFFGSGRAATTITMNSNATDHVFDIAANAYRVSIRDLSIQGYTAKTAGYAVNSAVCSYCIVENVNIDSIPNGIYSDTWVASKIQEVYVTAPEPSTGIGLYVTSSVTPAADTNDFIVDHFWIDGGAGTQPLAGIRVQSTGMLTLRSVSAIRSGTGLLVDPTGTKIVASLSVIGDSKFDANTNGNIRFAPDGAAATITRFLCDGCWASAATAGHGVSIIPVNSGIVNGAQFIRSQIYGNRDDGFHVEGATVLHVSVLDSRIGGNGTTTVSSGVGVGAGVTNWEVRGNVLGAVDGQTNTQDYCVFVTSGASDNYVIKDNICVNPAVSAISDAGTGVNKIVKSNKGVDDVVPSVASGATLALPANPVIKITGTTGATSVTGQWAGREVTLITIDGAVGFTAGATIGNTFTTTQNVPVKAVSDGTKLYLQ